MIKKNKSDFFEKVYTVVKKIPFGKVTTYGAIAKYLGSDPQTLFMISSRENTFPGLEAKRKNNSNSFFGS